MAKTVAIKYIVINAPSTYNLLLGRLALNRLGAVTTTTHMKMKLPSTDGKMITIKVDQKMAQKCYESSLKNCRTYTVAIQHRELGWIVEADINNERQPGTTEETREKVIKGKKFKLGTSLCKEVEDKKTNVILENMSTFAWSFVDMSGIDPNF